MSLIKMLGFGGKDYCYINTAQVIAIDSRKEDDAVVVITTAGSFILAGTQEEVVEKLNSNAPAPRFITLKLASDGQDVTFAVSAILCITPCAERNEESHVHVGSGMVHVLHSIHEIQNRMLLQ